MMISVAKILSWHDAEAQTERLLSTARGFFYYDSQTLNVVGGGQRRQKQ